jgi:hypothetical protein
VFCSDADCAAAPLMRSVDTPLLEAVREAALKLPFTTTSTPTGDARSTCCSADAGSLRACAACCMKDACTHATQAWRNKLLASDAPK